MPMTLWHMPPRFSSNLALCQQGKGAADALHLMLLVLDLLLQQGQALDLLIEGLHLIDPVLEVQDLLPIAVGIMADLVLIREAVVVPSRAIRRELRGSGHALLPSKFNNLDGSLVMGQENNDWQ